MALLDKKGIEKETVKLILLIVTFIALYFLVTQWGKTAKETSLSETCKLTVEAKAKTKIPLLSPEGIVKLNCPAQFQNILFEDETQVKEYLAQEMANCWWQFGEGRPQFADESETNLQCALCGVYTFSETLKQKYPRGIFGFDTYLAAHTVPNSKVTYAAYLTRNPDVQGSLIAPVQTLGETPINLNEDYAIYIAAGTKTSLGQTATYAGVGGGAGAVVGLALMAIPGIGWGTLLVVTSVGAIVGATNTLPDGQITTLVFSPYNKLEGKCKSLA